MSDTHDPRSPDEIVSAALADLPDTPMPQESADRLSAFVASLSSGDAPVTQQESASSSAEAGFGETVIPLPRQGGTHAAERPGIPRWLLPAMGGVAALLLGAIVIPTLGFGGDSASESGLTAVGSSPSAKVQLASLPAQSSGTNYSTAQLDEQARSLVAGAKSAKSGDYTPAPTLWDCVGELTDGRPETVLAIDDASFEGKRAIVVVNTFPGVEDTVDVWVVGPSCAKGDAALITFRRIAP